MARNDDNETTSSHDNGRVRHTVRGTFSGIQAGTVTGGVQIDEDGDDGPEIWIGGQQVR